MSNKLLIGVVVATMASAGAAFAADATTTTAPAAGNTTDQQQMDNAATAPSDATGKAAATGTAPATGNTAAASSVPTISATELAGDWSATKLIGKSVRNKANEAVGSVADVVFSPDGKVAAIVIGTGGFLGMGEKWVALPFQKFQDASVAPGTATDTIVMDLTRDQLNVAPEFKPATKPTK